MEEQYESETEGDKIDEESHDGLVSTIYLSPHVSDPSESTLVSTEMYEMVEESYVGEDEIEEVAECVLEATDSYQEHLEKTEGIDLSLLCTFFDKQKELGPTVLADPKYNALLNPFVFNWIFGFTLNVPVINFNSDEVSEIFYVSANVGVFYDYCKDKMHCLNGHRKLIGGSSIDMSFKWLVTSGVGKDAIINVWDAVDKSLVKTIFNFAPMSQCAIVGMGHSGAFFIVVHLSDGIIYIDLYAWTLPDTTPQDTYKITKNVGRPKGICFHPNHEDHIMIIFERKVLFLCLDLEANKFYNPWIPKIRNSSQLGDYTNGTYVEQSHECYVSTTKGYILKFGSTLYTRSWSEAEHTNRTMYINAIKICNASVYCMRHLERDIVTGDERGFILFFDHQLKILYWFSHFNLDPIFSISFQRTSKEYTVIENCSDQHLPTVHNYYDCQYEDRSDLYDTICKQKVPVDATLSKKPYKGRNFVLSTTTGGMLYVKFYEQTCKKILGFYNSNIVAVDVHDEENYIVVGFQRGTVTIFNYITHERVSNVETSACGNARYTEADGYLTTIKYSPQCLHLVAGKSNGQIWLLHPVLLTRRNPKPFQIGTGSIIKIVFSPDSNTIVYFDDRFTVCVLSLHKGVWISRGKLRSHYKPIKNILFGEEEPYSLYSLGEDRCLIRYEIPSDVTKVFYIASRDRVDQSNIPLNFTWYPHSKSSKTKYFLVCDNGHKYKLLNNKTLMCMSTILGPSNGCFRYNPVVKMRFLPQSDFKYLIYMNSLYIGIQKMPIDGNPYKYISCLGHPAGILDFVATKDGKYLFTIGQNDTSLIMWNIKTITVETLSQFGGEGLEPYYCLIQGDKSGWLFQEMQDMFSYVQILQNGESNMQPRAVGDYINVAELPDLLRACGFYPTDFEIENLLTDILYKDFEETGELRKHVTFTEFVKLYINHKPVYGYRLEELKTAFYTITQEDPQTNGRSIERDKFIEVLTHNGEQINVASLFKCTKTLVKHFGGGQSRMEMEFGFNFLDETIDFDYFMNEILGIDLDVKDEDLLSVEAEEELEESVDEIPREKAPFDQIEKI